jgi:hypothetical protein
VDALFGPRGRLTAQAKNEEKGGKSGEQPDDDSSVQSKADSTEAASTVDTKPESVNSAATGESGKTA